jgi:methylated-DNA-[protein]-cysteine S-methyltransferase
MRQFKTDLGTLYLTANEKGLTGIFWRQPPLSEYGGTAVGSVASCTLDQAETQLEEYFAGERRDFDLPLDLKGTEFQSTVWRELLRIPFGETVSYAQLAQKIRNPKAVRAVGTANGRNPLSIVVPCHRVINSDGGLGGYAGGLAQKARLLEIEKRHI